MQDPRRVRLIVWGLILGSALLRFWSSGILPISADEAYHWNWSRHLAACYHDHGGVLANSVWLAGQIIDPHDERSVRFAALIYMTLTMVIGAAFARRVVLEKGGSAIDSERGGLLAVMGLVFAPIFFFLQGYNVTDPPAIFFAMLALDQLHRALSNGRTWHWALAGLATAAAVQSKFLTLGLGPMGLILLWFERKNPHFPKPWQLLVTALVFVIGMTPMIWWNATNDWATIRFNFMDRHDSMSFKAHRYVPEFLVSQLGALSPLLAVTASAVLIDKIRKRRELSTGELILLLGAAVPLALFLVGSFSRRIGFHWTSSAWAPALVLVGAEAARSGSWLASGTQSMWRGVIAPFARVPKDQRKPFGRSLWRWSIGLAIGIFVAVHILAFRPQVLLEIDIGRWGRDGQVKTAKIAEIWGWPELAERIVAIRDEMLAAQDDGAGVFVSTNQFGTSSMVTFYTGSQVDAKLWSKRKDHGESLRAWQDLPSRKGQDMIFVTKKKVERFTDVLQERFARVDEPEEMIIELDGEPMRSFFIVRCYDFDGVEPYPLTPDGE